MAAQKTILIVEDSYTSFLLLAETLRFEGFEAQMASDVKEALKLISKQVPDLILLDLNMPEITGYDFLKMRDQLNISNVPIIVISALDSPESVNKTKSLGAADFISKPVSLGLMVEKVKSLIH
jgi:DNA-binding response OmpR family regulator